MNEHDRETVWLRQAATFTLAGQTRTIEIAIPVRPGATSAEVEALLAEADANMARLGQHLDAQITRALAGTPAASATAPHVEAPAAPAPALQAVEPPPAAPRPPRPPAAAAEAAAPARPPAAAEAAASARPPAAAEAAASARPPAAAAEATAPARQARPAPPPAAPLPDLTRQQFIAAAGELGLNPRQVMERLGVRSLEGINLREAIEALRRQLVKEPATSPAGAPAATHFFDEEEPEFTFSIAEGEVLAEDEEAEFAAPPVGATPHVAFGASTPEDDLDLEDVPDFGPPPQRAAPARGPRSVAEAPAPRASAPPSPQRERVEQVLASLRTARDGGPATAYQRTAYRNVVVDQLGETQAAALVRAIWRTTADKLTADQFEALIRWGKDDDFAEEVPGVLAALRRQERAAESPPPPPAARGRSAPPARPSGGA